jgi:hypothetical protein
MFLIFSTGRHWRNFLQLKYSVTHFGAPLNWRDARQWHNFYWAQTGTLGRFSTAVLRQRDP